MARLDQTMPSTTTIELFVVFRLNFVSVSNSGSAKKERIDARSGKRSKTNL
jgi:hypothetical protein